jgi:hypothetical protein
MRLTGENEGEEEPDSNHSTGDEEGKMAVVPDTDTVADPRAVMVVLSYAAIALFAVFTAERHTDHTDGAEVLCIVFPEA